MDFTCCAAPFGIRSLLLKVGSTQPLKPLLSLMANLSSDCVTASNLGVGDRSYGQDPAARVQGGYECA